VLIEKPIAATSEEADEVIELCARAGVRGAVGHVERCNPALVALRERAQAGQLGDLILIATERVGPFPPASATSGSSRTWPPTTSISCSGSATPRSTSWRRRRPTGWAAPTRTSCS
jgi:predicted dehydrogenase